MRGPAFNQYSCQGSLTQDELSSYADKIVDYYETHVEYGNDPDPQTAVWSAGDFRPRNSELIRFDYSAHPHYSRGNFNTEEFQFAQALDHEARGIWLRNGDSGRESYSIPLPAKSGDSLRFFPDFLWWPDPSDDICWALETTGRHLLSEKIRGKLISVGHPKVALIVKGRIDLGHEKVVADDGWSAMIPRVAMQPLVEHADEITDLLTIIAK